MTRKLFVTLLSVCCVAGVAPGAEEARVRVAREIMNKHKDAVIWVSAVLKTQMTGMGVQFGHGREQKAEAVGTVIDPSGLTVVSLSMLDPMSMMMEFAVNIGGDQKKFESKSQFSDVKMRLADGTEVPARLVLKDPDLDMAFLLPEKEEGKSPLKFSFIKLEATPKAKVLDELIVLGRLGKSLDRQPAVGFGRVSAVVTKPRTFFCVGAMSAGGLGTPAFTLDGKALGISLMRKGPRSGGMAATMTSAMTGGMSPVIVPAADVMEIAQQALKKKGT